MVRDWEFWILKVEELCYRCGKNKDADSFAVTAKLICILVFAYADCWFSHDVAYISDISSCIEIRTQYEQCHEKTGILHMRKQRCRSAVQ